MTKNTKEKMSRITDRIQSQISHLFMNRHDSDDAMDEEVVVDIVKLIYRDAENALQLSIGDAKESIE